MTKPILQGTNISKHFQGIVANKDVTICVSASEIVGLIGPNGCGKTTFFNCVSGNYPPDKGHILLDGRDITGLSQQETARSGIIRTFQHTRTYSGMTAFENLLISAPSNLLRPWDLHRSFPREVRNSALQLLDQFGLAKKKDDLAGQLSFGQQRLLEIAMAVMKMPRVMLLDEPTAGINPRNIEMLVKLIQTLAKAYGIALLVIEHNIPVVMDIAERVYCMNAGRIIVEGKPEEVVADPRVLEAYLGRSYSLKAETG